MVSPALKPASPLLSGASPPASLVTSVLKSLRSAHSRRSYRTGIVQLYAFKGARTLTPDLLYDWRSSLLSSASSSTVNTRLAAVRKFIDEGRVAGLLSEAEASALLRVQGLPYLGTKVGNWLTAPQASALLAVPNPRTLLGCRNRAILAIPLGAGLRVSEVAALQVEQICLRDGRPVFADILSKRHMRTVAEPPFVQTAVDAWLKRSGIVAGHLFRRGGVCQPPLGAQGIRNVVRTCAQRIGVGCLGPHDLRRTCARLMWAKGVPIEQIQIILGHQSIVTTLRYLGTLQNLANAPNDALAL